MSENTTVDDGSSALHKTVPWYGGFTISSTRHPAIIAPLPLLVAVMLPVVPIVGATAYKVTDNDKVKELSLAAGMPALGVGLWICGRTVHVNDRDHAEVVA